MGSVVLDCKIITRFSAQSCKLCKGLSVAYVYLNVTHPVLVFLEQDEVKVPWHQLKPFLCVSKVQLLRDLKKGCTQVLVHLDLFATVFSSPFSLVRATNDTTDSVFGGAFRFQRQFCSFFCLNEENASVLFLQHNILVDFVFSFTEISYNIWQQCYVKSRASHVVKQ